MLIADAQMTVAVVVGLVAVVTGFAGAILVGVGFVRRSEAGIARAFGVDAERIAKTTGSAEYRREARRMMFRGLALWGVMVVVLVAQLVVRDLLGWEW